MIAGRRLATRAQVPWLRSWNTPARVSLAPPSHHRCASSSSSSSPASSQPTSTNGNGNTKPFSRIADDSESRLKQKRQERQIFAVAFVAFFTAGSLLWVARPSKSKNPAPTDEVASDTPPMAPRITINARSPLTGERIQKAVNLISPRDVNNRLTQNERTQTVYDEPGKVNLVARYDTNFVASNNPIEDRHAEAIVESAIAKQSPNTLSNAKGNLAFFAVMDGHSGYHTSQYLSQKLIAFVAVELDKVFRELGDYASIAQTKASMPAKLWQSIMGTSNSTSSVGLNGDPEIVKRAITRAFVGLDKEIVNTPIQMLKEYELSKSGGSETQSSSLSTLAHSIFPAHGPHGGQTATTATSHSAYEVMRPAMSGSCALMTYIDSAQRDVYVACTGDSRAIAGWYDPRSQRWSIEPLSTDQTGRNLDEVKRMQSEHPSSENDTVIMRGRVLGGLEPTRAFGDARYKWTADVQRRLNEAFVPSSAPPIRSPPALFKTPPYVTARPEVEWRRLPTGEGSKQLKFIVMATDGLWDMLSNEEVGSLVAGHLAEFKGQVGATQLQSAVLKSKDASPASIVTSLTSAMSSSAQQPPAPQTRGHHPLASKGENQFTFQDSNLATHLVRNALGGADRIRLTGLLSILAPDARRYRDDITVNVILFKDAKEADRVEHAQTSDPPKAKL